MIRLFNIAIPANLVLLILSETVLLAGCYMAAGIFALDPTLDPWFYLIYENGWTQLILVTITSQLGLYMLDLYDLRRHPRSYLVQQMCLMLGFSFLVQAIFGYSESAVLQLPQWTMVYGSALVFVAIPLWREVFFLLLQNRLPKQRLVFWGSSPLASEVAQHLRSHSELGFQVEGYIGLPGDFPDSLTHLDRGDPMQDVLQSKQDIVLVIGNREQISIKTLLDLRGQGVQLREASSLFEEVYGRVALQTLDPYQLIFSDGLAPRWTVRLQSIYSFIGGSIGLVLALPIMAVVAVAVKLSSPGPALYSQERVGLNGRPFRILKFRSMYVNAEARTGPVWASKNDSRVTPVGRWLRKLRLDELPQFFNVVRGHMALVGPRPERPEFCTLLEKEIPYFHQRHSVKPGITGWAQINLKYGDSIEDAVRKLEYDLFYVKHLAPALDFYIIFHTLKVMLLSRGAQ